MNHFLKKYKFNQIQSIKKNYNSIYLFRYHNLTVNENILLKKKLKKTQLSFLVLKQTLIKKELKNIKGQGSLLLIYGNQDQLDISFLNDFLNMKLVYFIYKNQLFSEIKSKKIFPHSKASFVFNLQSPFLMLTFLLKKMNTSFKANIA